VAVASLATFTGLAASSPPVPGRIGPAYSTTANGRHLQPAGQMTTVGNFPTGGALSPDGKHYWVVNSGHGHDSVDILQVTTGKIIQNLPLPGGYGAVAFSPDGGHAYVSGEPKGSGTPTGPTKGDAGDVIHVYAVGDQGTAAEQAPILLPKAGPGNNQSANTKEDWPVGLAVSPDGKTLVVALNQSDKAALIDLASAVVRLVPVGQFPGWVAVDRTGRWAFVTNEYDGTVSKIDIATGQVTQTTPVGGPGPNPDGRANTAQNAHPEGIIADPNRDLVYIAVANRDLVASMDTNTGQVTGYVSVGRGESLGTEPVALALSPDGNTLYSADEGEDAIAVIDLKEGRVSGRVPTAAFPTAVAVTKHGNRLVWVAGKGLGAGPNPEYGSPFANSNAAPYGSYVLDKLLGRVGVLPIPEAHQLATYTATADQQVMPQNAQSAPAASPLRAGGPIKHIFYVVRENRTYDQIFGSEPRGDGDPKLELFDDNGVAGPTGGITPNAHALSRMFPLLDHLYADSEVSKDGHKITSGAYGTDFVERYQHPNYSGRGRRIETDTAPVASPPKDYLFDQAIRQGVSFRNYGEYAAATVVDDGRPTFAASVAGKDATYPGRFGCSRAPISPANCDTDSGTLGTGPGQQAANSRFDHFEAAFTQQLASGSVPSFNYLIMPNDHTNGTAVGKPTPQAEVADNDLAVGQLVDLISHSPIWSESAIFVVEDDSQDGADHVDAHRMPSMVISPYAKHGSVVTTRYDQDSVIRSMELVLGLKPLSLVDANATPMYDAFTATPDLTAYAAITPQQSLTATNGAKAPDAALSAAMPLTTPDAVPQQVLDAILWHSVHGQASTPPPPGPNASPAEAGRAKAAMDAFNHGKDAAAIGPDADD